MTEFDTYILPSALASGLINGDWSGYTFDGLEEYDAFEAFIKDKGACVGMDEEEWFQWGHDLNQKQGTTVTKFYFEKR